MRIIRPIARPAVMLATLIVALCTSPAVAADREYRESFNWGDSTVGFAGWMFDEFDGAGNVVPQKFYRGQTEDGPLGRGLTITPTGAANEKYPSDISGRFTYSVPGQPGAVVDLRQATFQRVTGRVRQRQFLRYELRDPMGVLASREFGDGSTGTTSDVPLTNTTPNRAGRSALMWLFTPACTNCTTVDPNQGSINYAGGAELALIDHEAPTIAASGPLWDARGKWVKATPDGVSLRSRDPGSGVRSFTFQRAGARPLTRSGDCDLKYGDRSRGSQVCRNAPPDGQITASSIGTLPSGQSTFGATARDRAGQQSSRLRWTVKVDRDPPRILASPALSRLDRDIVGPAARLTIPARAVDTRSGVRLITAQLSTNDSSDDQSERTLYSACSASRSQCPATAAGQFDLDLRQFKGDTITIRLTSTDLVGNRTVGRATTITVGRKAPGKPRLRPTPSPDRPTALVFDPVFEKQAKTKTEVRGYLYTQQTITDGNPKAPENDLSKYQPLAHQPSDPGLYSPHRPGQSVRPRCGPVRERGTRRS